MALDMEENSIRITFLNIVQISFIFVMFLFKHVLVIQLLLIRKGQKEMSFSGFSIANLNVHGWTDGNNFDNIDRVVALVKVRINQSRNFQPFEPDVPFRVKITVQARLVN